MRAHNQLFMWTYETKGTSDEKGQARDTEEHDLVKQRPRTKWGLVTSYSCELMKQRVRQMKRDKPETLKNMISWNSAHEQDEGS